MNTHTIILFYSFAKVENPEKFRDEQKELCKLLGLLGRMLIAPEGINATFEGTTENTEKYKAALHAIPQYAGLLFKESEGTGHAFTKLEIKVRKEIVTMEAGEFDIPKETAREMTAAELQELYKADEDFVVLDLRNDFEIEVGAFEKTVNPALRNFRDLKAKLPELEHLKNKKVIAVCTGGIRCEKATCLLTREGFTDLYQLKDGIHTYMQQFPGEYFKGSLFVFDNRMTTPVVDTPNREIIGKCKYCTTACETFYSDDSVRPSLKIICCENCYQEHKNILRSCVPTLS